MKKQIHGGRLGLLLMQKKKADDFDVTVDFFDGDIDLENDDLLELVDPCEVLNYSILDDYLNHDILFV